MGNSRKSRALESVIGIGEKYGKTAGQILIKFQVQRQIAVIPKDRFEYKTLYFSFKMGFRLEKNTCFKRKWPQRRWKNVVNGPKVYSSL